MAVVIMSCPAPIGVDKPKAADFESSLRMSPSYLGLREGTHVALALRRHQAALQIM